MYTTILLSLAALASFTSAYTVHEISVGGTKPDGTPNLVFSPNNIKASAGDKVRFTFNVKNHTVTQSSFGSPCSKLQSQWGQPDPFDSGFMPVSPGQTDLPTFEITVNDTNPIWGYCRQTNPPNKTHCQSGMVFAVNAPDSGNTFDKFLSMAEASTSQNNGLPPTSTTQASSWTTNAAYAATHTITVGGDVGFRYTPPNITANVGDKVKFIFMQKNHTVTQASFGDPCRKIEDTTWPPVYGFDSGFNAVSPNATTFPEFTITVNDTNPIWGYCRQQAANFSHCGVGMVFSINAQENTPHSFEAFQLLAVQKNGTGFVNPFGNITSAPLPTDSWSSSYPPSGAKDLDAVSAASDSNDSNSLSNKLLTYGDITIALLIAVIILLCALIVLAIRNARRGGGDVLPTRSIAQSYKPVPLTTPSSKMQDDGSHDYEISRYSD